MSNDLYETPDLIYQPLHKEFGFKRDACATAETTECDLFYTEQDDALAQDIWSPGPVWCNPPYSNVAPWLKMASEQDTIVVCLVPPATSTHHWRDFVFPLAAEIRFVTPRISFMLDGRAIKGNKYDSAVIIFDPRRVGERLVKLWNYKTGVMT